MWLKMVGCGFIIAAGTAIGFSLASRYSERPRQVRQLIGGLTALSSYIGYGALPLADALTRAATGLDGAVGDLFRRTAATVAGRGWLSPRTAFEEALAGDGTKLAFYRAECEVLLQLASNLGSTSREEQQKQLAMAVSELRQIELEALRLRDANVKMYRYLGICGALAVVILLV
jgi:stage III sporulation protein AB